MAAKDMYHNDPSSLPKHACSQMFDDIELIYDLDKKFLQELEDRMRDWYGISYQYFLHYFQIHFS